MAEWLEQASQRHEIYCHDLEIMSSSPGQVDFGVHSTSVQSRTWTQKNYMYYKHKSIVKFPCVSHQGFIVVYVLKVF